MKGRWILTGLVSMGLCLAAGTLRAEDKAKDKTETDVKITIDQAPAAVKATIEKEAKGGKVGDIEKAVKDGKAVYEAEVTIEGKKFEVKVAEDGKLISKKADDEDKDGKDEKGEHKD